AYSVDCNQVPFSCGTPAYMSPQQQNEGSATESDDVYALGSVVVRLVCGVDPRKVKHIEPERRAQSIAMLAVTQGGRLAGTLSRCLDDDPTARPPLGELARALNESKSGTPKNNSRLQQDWMPSRQTLRAAYNGLMSASAKTTDGALFISAREKSAGSGDYEYELLRSAHNGNAGVLYLISRYSSCGLTDPPVDRNVANSIVDWLLAHRSTSDDQMPGLHFGEAGVATALSEAIAARLIDPGPWTRTYLQEVFSGTLDWPDFTHGAAGQGIAALTCARLLGDPFPYDYARSCTEYLIGVQDRSGAWPLPDDVKELAGVRYTGFAHGAAGIVYYLLEYLRETSDPAPERSIDAALQWLISLRVDTKPGSWPIQPDSSEAWSWWCHGGPGIALAFLKAYEVFGDKAFAEIAEQALLAIPSDIRSGNLSHCHGLSGIGEAYLEAYRVLGDEAWLALATHVARTILALSRETAEGWLVWKAENPHSPTADLMLGSGGICHFLLRLVEADYREISLPLHVPRNVTPVSMQ
ncbi:MAG: protein kinase/lanthionine synthetase C family protein, partial [Planctomycetota bacterium]